MARDGGHPEREATNGHNSIAASKNYVTDLDEIAARQYCQPCYNLLKSGIDSGFEKIIARLTVLACRYFVKVGHVVLGCCDAVVTIGRFSFGMPAIACHCLIALPLSDVALDVQCQHVVYAPRVTNRDGSRML